MFFPLQECDCKVLSQVLQQLNNLLQDRCLTLSSLPDLSPLCQLLCHLLDDRARLQKLRNISGQQSKLDIASAVYPVLTTLITYPSHLDRAAQVRGDFSWRDFWWGVGGGRIRMVWCIWEIIITRSLSSLGEPEGEGGGGGHYLESFHIAQMGLTTILQVFFLSGKCFITSSSQKKKLSCAVA